MALREPHVDDAPAMGRLHVAAWQAAYRGGLMPDAYLDTLDPDDRARFWADTLARSPGPRAVRLVATEANDAVVGFCMAGPAGGDANSDFGEIYVVNVHPDHWRAGHGTTLLDAGTTALAAHGFDWLCLWVHPGNERARSFYEARGWSSTGERRTQEVHDVTVDEVRYERGVTL